MATILMIVAPKRFRDEELFVTQAELEEAGHVTVIASLTKGTCLGSRGGEATAELTLTEVRIEDYAGVVFVGGGGATVYFADKDALHIARAMYARRKVTAAICLAPVILANAGVLEGKHATVAGTEAKTIVAKGAEYMGPGVTVDGNIVTANGPKSSKLFAQKIIERLQTRA
jgi:protease I